MPCGQMLYKTVQAEAVRTELQLWPVGPQGCGPQLAVNLFLVGYDGWSLGMRREVIRASWKKFEKREKHRGVWSENTAAGMETGRPPTDESWNSHWVGFFEPPKNERWTQTVSRHEKSDSSSQIISKSDDRETDIFQWLLFSFIHWCINSAWMWVYKKHDSKITLATDSKISQLSHTQKYER
jgi:hypothetical protein